MQTNHPRTAPTLAPRTVSFAAKPGAQNTAFALEGDELDDMSWSFGHATYRLVGDHVVALPRINLSDARSYVVLGVRSSAQGDTQRGTALEAASAASTEAARSESVVTVSRDAFAPAYGADIETSEVPRYLLLHHLTGLAETAHTMEALYADLGRSEHHRALRGGRQTEMLARTTQQMSDQVRYVTEIVQTLPLLEAQGYLTEVRERDGALYDRLVSEQTLEEHAEDLARTLDTLPPSPARDAKESELRALLAHLFDLKQANRRDEAQQLQDRLDRLNQQLDARERLKAKIVERQLRKMTQRD